MSGTKAITLRLDPGDYELLEAEARRLGIRPGTPARVYVSVGLAGTAETEAERKRHMCLEALQRLAALREELRGAGYPPVDAVKLVREGREELEPRPHLS